MKIVKILIVLTVILISNNSIAQTLRKMFQEATILFEEKCDEKYTDTVVSYNIPFEKIIDSKMSDSLFYYKLYYNSNILNKVEHYNLESGYLDFDIHFRYLNNFVFYNMKIYPLSREDGGGVIDNLFWYDLTEKINVSVFFSSLDEDGDYYLKEKIPNDIIAVYKLDDKLSPDTRINFYDEEFLTFSNLTVTNNNFIEESISIKSKKCKFNTDANFLNVRELYCLLNGRGCLNKFDIYYSRKITQDELIWYYPYYGYGK